MEGEGETVAAAAAISKQNVVVVGGGIAGSLLARSIQNYANVTLIDPYDVYFIAFDPVLGLHFTFFIYICIYILFSKSWFDWH